MIKNNSSSVLEIRAEHYEKQIPSSWEVARFDDVANVTDFVANGSFETLRQNVKYLKKTGYAILIRVRDFTKNWNKDYVYVDKSAYEFLEKSKVYKGDLIIANVGDPGKAFIVPDLKMPMTLGPNSVLIRPKIGISNKYISYFFQSDWAIELIAKITSGTAQKKFNKTGLRSTYIPIPPFYEQERIIEKLEEVLSDLEAGIKELKAAQKKLVQYRQSLLKSAVEGTLTAEWRTKNTPKETGKELLQRILKERHKNWEEKQLAKYKEQGKEPPKGWQDKYPEPVQPDTKDLPQLPNGWIWASLDMLGAIVSGVAKGTKRDSSIVVREVPYLRVANVQRGYLDLKEIKTIYSTEKDIKELTLRYGDILFNEGGDRDKLGRGWVWRDEVENCIHQNHVFRMRPFLSEIVPELVSHYGNTFGKTWFQSSGKQTTNLASINMSILRSFPVPFAPANEQLEMLSLLNNQVQLLDMQEDATKKALLQSDAQKKNVLKSAFSGQLVSQSVEDEPVGVLLERIKSEGLKSGSVKTLKVKGRRQMKKIIHESLREWIISRDDKPFSFGEINKSISSEYEQIKDAIFDLLSETNPIVEQVFNEDSGHMLFKRVKQ